MPVLLLLRFPALELAGFAKLLRSAPAGFRNHDGFCGIEPEPEMLPQVSL